MSRKRQRNQQQYNSSDSSEVEKNYKTLKFKPLFELGKELGVTGKKIDKILKDNQISVDKVIPLTSKNRNKLKKIKETEINNHKLRQTEEEHKQKLIYENHRKTPLVYENDEPEDLIDLLDDWYQRIEKSSSLGENSGIPILGIVSLGGFLQGENENDPFVLSLQSNINIFIGDRGSGKSTIINLLSLIVNSLNIETESNTKLKIAPTARQDFHNSGSFIAAEMLKQKSVKKYACYFYDKNQSSRKLYVFYADPEKHSWSLFERNQDRWIKPEKEDLESIFPDVLVFNQGRIQHIIEHQNDVVINQVLEELNPEIKSKNDELFDFLKQLVQDYQNLKKRTKTNKDSSNQFKFNEKEEVFIKLELDKQDIEEWLLKKKEDIKSLKQLLNDSTKTIQVLNKIEDDLKKSNRERIPLTQNSLLDLMKSKSTGLDVLYLGFIYESLQRKIHTIKAQNDITRKSSVDEILEILEKRLSIVYEIATEIDGLYIWNKAIQSLNRALKSFLNKQSNFIEEKRKYCDLIKNKLSFIKEQEIQFTYSTKDNTNHTSNLENDSIRYEELSKDIIHNYNELIHNQDLDDYLKTLRSYKASIGFMMNKLSKITDTVDEKNPNTIDQFIDFSVDIELRQGNIYRPFKKLSYGQKTGIIITILSIMTEAEMIVIDQPEDNLDNAAIAKILIPTIEEVTKKGIYTTFVTHNSALVLGLKDLGHCVFVMKDPTEFGGILHFGTLKNPQIVESVFEILEQGLDALKIQFRFFQDFEFFQEMNKELNFIGDTSISNIIADIRNLIQYEPSQTAIYENLHHDLKNVNRPSNNNLEKLQNIILKKLSNFKNSFLERQQNLVYIETIKDFIQPRVYFTKYLKYIYHSMKNRFSNRFISHNKSSLKTPSSEAIDILFYWHKEFFKFLESNFDELQIEIERISSDFKKVLIQFEGQRNETLEILDNYDAMIREANFKNINLYSILSNMRQTRLHKNIDFSIDENLKNIEIYADDNQIKIIFRNIFDNSIDAIDKAKKERKKVKFYDYKGCITVKLAENNPSSLTIELIDNGIGISDNHKNLIYKRSFSSKEKVPKKHGKGCMNIANLMAKNEAKIFVDFNRTIYQGRNSGTVQIMTFKRLTEQKVDL
ncbi:MAG: GHKL domain-containing protein [Symploca sp. SIO2E9]|nr:GHKL domain-containing protein [Symploca sp. SIO2E9]